MKMTEINGDLFYEITSDAVKDILPDTYYINLEGLVYSFKTNRFKYPTYAKEIGYYVMSFRTTDGKSRMQLIHRIMMIMFYNIHNFKEMQVNHIDGNKTNNDIDNFEWLNLAGNNEHAQETGLLPTGELCDWSKLTEKEVREICQHFVDNDYGTLNNLAKQYNVSPTTIGDIARRISWKNVSCNYEFDYNIRGHFTDEQVHYMCQVFQMHKGESFNYCYYYIILNLAMQDCRNIRTRIQKIYNKDPNSFANITSQYDY